MRGHFRYLRFNTFPMTPRTPQCEMFWALLSSSKHSGVPKDSKSPTFPSVGLHPHTWPKWGCDRLHSQLPPSLLLLLFLLLLLLFAPTVVIHAVVALVRSYCCYSCYCCSYCCKIDGFHPSGWMTGRMMVRADSGVASFHQPKTLHI